MPVDNNREPKVRNISHFSLLGTHRQNIKSAVFQFFDFKECLLYMHAFLNLSTNQNKAYKHI